MLYRSKQHDRNYCRSNDESIDSPASASTHPFLLDMKDDELLEKILGVAFLTTLKTDEKTLKNLLSASLGLQITREIYDRLSNQSEIEREKAALTLRVANYLKSNPRASEQQKIEFLRSEFENFSQFLRQN